MPWFLILILTFLAVPALAEDADRSHLIPAVSAKSGRFGTVSPGMGWTGTVNGSCQHASYYWQGKRVATGARYNPHGLTVAHKTLPFGTRVEFTLNGRSVTATVNDRGPFIHGRVWDLSLGSARAIGLDRRGVACIGARIVG